MTEFDSQLKQREWIFSVDWNDPVSAPAFNVFQLLGITFTWDALTWMCHVALGLIVIRFGHVTSI